MEKMRITDTNIIVRKPVSGVKEGDKKRSITVPVHADITKTPQTKGDKESRKPLPPPKS